MRSCFGTLAGSPPTGVGRPPSPVPVMSSPVLVVGGSLVAAAVVVGQLVADDGIVLVGIETDLDWPDEQLD